MKYNRVTRRAFIDRLEQKYMKKIQRQAFRHESEQINQQLGLLSGSSLRNWRREDADGIGGASRYTPRYS